MCGARAEQTPAPRAAAGWPGPGRLGPGLDGALPRRRLRVQPREGLAPGLGRGKVRLDAGAPRAASGKRGRVSVGLRGSPGGLKGTGAARGASGRARGRAVCRGSGGPRGGPGGVRSDLS